MKNCAPKKAKKSLPPQPTKAQPGEKGGKMQGVRSTTRNGKY